MSPFRHPAEPYSIDAVMASIHTQLVEGRPDPQEDAGSPAPIVSSHTETSRLLAQLELLRQRQNLNPGYRIHSHRPVIGRMFDAVRRLIHWGARPYTDAVREKQEAFNDAALQALREVSAQLELAQKELEALATLKAWHAWHGHDFDLETFFSTVTKEQRLAALDTTRGTYEDIRYRQSRYAELFKGLPGQVLDIGCGRGEFVNMMRYEGIETWGCDTDPAMIEIATREGASAYCIDGLTALRSVPDYSLGGVFAAQVVEHLFPGVLLELLRLIRQKLAPGGRVVLETLNPATLGVLAKSYYRDLDHKQPIHPEYLKLLMELAGFDQVELNLTAPFGEHENLATLPPAEQLGMTEQGRDAIQARLDQLNQLLYGPQDYYINARQPNSPLPAAPTV